MSKKKIVAIVLFIFLGLFMFTFANPGEVKPVLKDPIKDVVEPKDNQDDDLNNDNNQDITTPVVNPVTNIPNIKVEPKRVIILYGDQYDVMTGVTLDSDEKLEINADITDTTKLNIGTYTITYTVSKNNNTKSSTRELVVLDPKGDEDHDGFTNEEEIKSEDPTDPFDPESHPETIDPIIRLLGDNPYKMAVGSRYVEAGVEIELDPHDNITKESDVKVESNLDVDSVGKYTLTYTITDRYGKSASVTRDVEVFKDENGNNIPDEDEEHYTVKFESEGRGKLEGTLIYENILTDLTFEAAGINVPTAVADNYYELKGWEPVEPTSETLVTSDVTYKAVFGPINDENQNGIADEEETYKLTIKYVYVDGKEASETYIKDVVYNMSYRVETPVIEKYTADKAVVEGVMPKEDVTVTVTYKATNDENGNNIPDEDEEHYTVKFEAGEHGTLEGTLVYENILTDLTFEAAGIIVPSVTPNEGFKFVGWEPLEPTSETLVTSDITYVAKYDIDDSLVQVGIEVTLKPNTQLQFQVNSNVDIKNYLIVKRVFKDGHKEEITSYTTDFTTANVGEDITLTVTDGEFTNNEYTYDITYEEAYDTQFVVKFNLNKSFVRYVPKRGFLDWDYNSYTKETIKVDEDFLEITETYLENIEITNIKAEYIDGTTQILKTIDNEFSTGGLFDVKGSTVGIRWSKYENDAFYNPVYRTSSINSTNIKYVYITYERTFSTNDKKNYTLKFENRNGEFVAISEETN